MSDLLTVGPKFTRLATRMLRDSYRSIPAARTQPLQHPITQWVVLWCCVYSFRNCCSSLLLNIAGLHQSPGKWFSGSWKVLEFVREGNPRFPLCMYVMHAKRPKRCNKRLGGHMLGFAMHFIAQIYFILLIPSVLWRCWLGGRKGIRPVKTEWWCTGVVICLERDADWHMAQLMPLPLTVSCFCKIQIGFTFLVSAHPGSPGKRAVKRLCVYSSNLLHSLVMKDVSKLVSIYHCCGQDCSWHLFNCKLYIT